MMPAQVGPYTIHEKLGAGGMGTVYLGRHNVSGLMAAVKVLPASLAQEEGFVERFAREIDSMKRLSNNHIVRLYESGVDGGTYYYAMEYVAGENLTSVLRREKRLPWQRAVEISIQICHALKAAHDAGIIHRDLKPSNLMITPEGTVKLTDFGVAQVFASGRLTKTGGIVGTAEFMSPEQAQGQRANKQSDLYSLGAVLYVLVTGRPPFSGATAVDVMHKHKFGRFDPVRNIVPDIPRLLDDVISQLLEKDPAKRFPNAFVLSRRLEHVVKKVEFAEEQTLAESRATGGSGSDIAIQGESSGPGPATMMQNLVRSELDDMNRGSRLGNLLNNTWVLVGLLLLLIAGGVLWFRDRAPEQKFRAGMALLDQPEGVDWLRARVEFFDPLLAADPDKWRPRLAEPLQKIDKFVAKRNAGLQERRNLPEPKTEAERFLKLANSYRTAGDSVHAEKTLKALILLLEHDPAQKELYDLCKDEYQKWHAADVDQRYDWLKAAVDQIEQLVKDGELDPAREMASSLQELYGDDPGARPFVSRAEQLLFKDPAKEP